MDRFRYKKILIVEDDISMRETLQELFFDMGITVSLAQDGHSALEILREQNYDVVISDKRMPGMDGLALIKQINDLPVRPIIFMFSGHNDISESERQSLHIEQIFEKPFNVHTLVEAVSLSLSRKAIMEKS